MTVQTLNKVDALAFHVSRWIVRTFALTIAWVIFPAVFFLPLLTHGLDESGWGGLGLMLAYLMALAGSAMAGTVFAIVIALRHETGWKSRVLLGAISGSPPTLLIVWFAPPDWFWSLTLGITCAAAAGCIYWACTHWVEQALGSKFLRSPLSSPTNP